MKKSLLTSGFLLGLITFTLGQVSQKKHVTPHPSSLQHDNEIIALKKQDLQKESNSASSPAFILITSEKLNKPKKEDTRKSKSVNK